VSLPITQQTLSLYFTVQGHFITVAHVLREDALGKCDWMAGGKAY